MGTVEPLLRHFSNTEPSHQDSCNTVESFNKVFPPAMMKIEVITFTSLLDLTIQVSRHRP